MIIRFYGSEPQGPKCLSVNNGLQGKAKVWVMYSVSIHDKKKKKGKRLWRQEITPFILTVEPWVAANALWGQRQLTTSIEIQLSHVKKRNLSISFLGNLRLYEKNLVKCCRFTLNTWAIYVQKPNSLLCSVVPVELLERHQSDRILEAYTIYPQCCKGLNLKVLPVSTDPHLRPGYPEGYYQLNSIHSMLISFGD